MREGASPQVAEIVGPFVTVGQRAVDANLHEAHPLGAVRFAASVNTRCGFAASTQFPVNMGRDSEKAASGESSQLFVQHLEIKPAALRRRRNV